MSRNLRSLATTSYDRSVRSSQSSLPASIVIRLASKGVPDELPRKMAEAAAELLVAAWWPTATERDRDDMARAVFNSYEHEMGLLFTTIHHRHGPALDWAMLRVLPPWPLQDGRPVRPPSATRLVRDERVLSAEIAYLRAGGNNVTELERRLAAVRTELGSLRRARVDRGLGHLTPKLAARVAVLASQISKALPDPRIRSRGGERSSGALSTRARDRVHHKSGVFRTEVLERIHDIVFALYGIRVPRARLTSLIQKKIDPRTSGPR
jgi:hypothetical protein